MTLLKNIFKALEVITLLALLGLALFLILDIFLKFQSKDSSFTKHQAPLSTLPTISICFDPINNERLKYGKDFNISKYNNNGDYLADTSRVRILKEGENPDERVTFTILNTCYHGQCYQVTPSEYQSQVKSDVYEVISVNYLHQTVGTGLLNTIKVYITSKYNAGGVLLSYWLDGDNLEFTMDRSTYTEIGLEELETIHMKEKTACSHEESFYECLMPKYLNAVDSSKCEKKCLTMTIDKKFGPSKYPTCNLHTIEHVCANDFAFNYLLNASSSGLCLRPCKINEYFGKITYFDPEFNKDGIGFAYFYRPPEAKIIEEEYLLYDFVAVISAIGGSLFLVKEMNGYIQKLLRYIQKCIERDPISEDQNKISSIKTEAVPTFYARQPTFYAKGWLN